MKIVSNMKLTTPEYARLLKEARLAQTDAILHRKADENFPNATISF